MTNKDRVCQLLLTHPVFYISPVFFISSDDYDNPTMFPSTISMLLAAGTFGRPGMRIISPAIATMNSAPRLMTISLMSKSKP